MAAYAKPEEDSGAEVTSEEPEVELPDLATRVEWVEDSREALAESRKLQVRDCDYYDGIQWTREEVKELERRGQPVVTINLIKRKIDTIIGEAIEKRVDPATRPRTPQHEDSARAMTDALRFVEEEQDFDAVDLAVLKDRLTWGYGGGLKEYTEDGKHAATHIHADRLIYDHHSRSPDFSDAKFKGFDMWMYVEDAVERWPDSAKELQSYVGDGSVAEDEAAEDTPRSWVDKKNKRVRVTELYFQVGGDYYRACFTKGKDLEEPQRTWLFDEERKHTVCPLEMESCYVDRDGMRYGVVRSLISPQDEVNKRTSKYLWAMSVNGVIYEEGAILDVQEFLTALADPGGAAKAEEGALADGRVVQRKSTDMVQGDLTLLQEAKNAINMIGPSAANLPDLPESASGVAFARRQKAASRELAPVDDGQRRWRRRMYMLDYLCVRQSWTEEKWLRVSDDEELTGYRFVALNRRMTRAQRFQEMIEKGAPPPSALSAAAGGFAPLIMRQVQQAHGAMAQQMGPAAQDPQHLLAMIAQHPLMQEPITTNQVDQMLVDIVLDEAPDTVTLAEEQFEKLSQLAGPVLQANPGIAQKYTAMLLKASSLPNKKELIADMEKGPDPQQVQMQQQIQQLQLGLEQARLAFTQAQTQAAQSQVQLNTARAAQAAADAQTATPKAVADVELKRAQAAKTVAEARVVEPRAQAEIDGRQADSFARTVGAGAP